MLGRILALSMCSWQSMGFALSLEQAISTALVKNPASKQFQATTGSARLAIDAASMEFAFNIQPESTLAVSDSSDAGGSYGLRLSKKNRYGGELIVRGVTDALLGSGSGERFSLQYAQPLFRRAGKLVNEEPVVRRERAYLSEQRSRLLFLSQLSVQVAEAYENARRLELQRTADRQAMERAESLYKLTLAKERLGRTTRIDTLRVQQQQGEARNRFATTQEQYQATRNRLAELMGRSDIHDELLQETPLMRVDYRTADEAVRIALANRLDYAEIQQSFEDAARASRIAKQNTKPGLRLITGYEHRANADFPNTSLGQDTNTWYVRVTADNDTNLRRQKIEYQQAVLRQSRAMEDIRARNLAITREVEEALATHRRTHEQLSVLEGNYEHASARLKLARRLFSLGRMDGFSVTDAEQAYFNAQSRWLSGKSETTVSAYRLLHRTGTLVDAPLSLKPGAY
ncbi:MAG: TolC family protein [Pseudomonadota bacterium]